MDSVVVITGSSRGFGRSMAEAFARAAARVVVSSRDAASVEEAVTAIGSTQALGVVCDVRDLDQVRRLADTAVQRFRRIDVWVNNAGLSHRYAKMGEIDPASWRASFETNFFGTAHGCRVALEVMLPARGGQIINVLGAGAHGTAANQSAYGTSKAAIARLTQTLAAEYSGSGVVIHAIQPGMIWTEMLTRAEGVDNPGLRSRMEWAMRVFGNPPDVPAQYVVRMVEHPGKSGQVVQVITPRVYVPRMIREALGGGKRNPRPWEAAQEPSPR